MTHLCIRVHLVSQATPSCETRVPSHVKSLIHPPHPFLGPQVTLFALMDQEVARRLFAEGAALVLLDVPERTEVGIDYNCWNVGPRFKGIKMIPPGFHFVFYR